MATRPVDAVIAAALRVAESAMTDVGRLATASALRLHVRRIAHDPSTERWVADVRRTIDEGRAAPVSADELRLKIKHRQAH